jgi:hypothetical protein
MSCMYTCNTIKRQRRWLMVGRHARMPARVVTVTAYGVVVSADEKQDCPPYRASCQQSAREEPPLLSDWLLQSYNTTTRSY